MTRVRLLSVACGAALLALAPARAAPIPKGASKGNATPDLKQFFDAVGKAVAEKKWPAAAEEEKLRETPRVAFERMLMAAGRKQRALPVDFARITKLDVSDAYQAVRLDAGFLIAGSVRLNEAKNSVIFASGDVQITSARNCVVVARNVRCTSVDNCVVVAGEFVRLTSARPLDGSEPSVLLAGHWIRTTSMAGTVCHVLRPTDLPAPDEKKFGRGLPQPPIRTNGADDVIFLNAQSETGANGPKNCTYLPQKDPIVRHSGEGSK